MKTGTKWIISILVGMGVLGSAAAFHKGRWCHQGHGHWQSEHRAEWMVERISEKLDLNESQTVSLNRLKERLTALREEIREGREQQRLQFMEMITAPEMDQQFALDMVSQSINTMQQKAPEVIAAIAEFHHSLDPKQKQKVKEFLQDRFDHGR